MLITWRKLSNSPEQLLCLSQESIDRMSEGNFYHRSCNSNCEEWKALMIKNGNFVEYERRSYVTE